MRNSKLCSLLLVSLLASAQIAEAQQGLSGPSSVEADLVPGDGVTDPQFRSDFPRDIAPTYFDWKDRLAEKGIRFNFDYLALYQSSSVDNGADHASSAIFRFYGNWQATEQGSLTFKIEDRRHSEPKHRVSGRERLLTATQQTVAKVW